MTYARSIAESLGPFIGLLALIAVLGWVSVNDHKARPLPFRREWDAFIAETPRG